MKFKIVIFYTAIYVLLFFFALNFNYIEGDDATTILHHAMGRDVSFQPTYSEYHSMFDVLLSLFNTENEFFLRIFSIGISFFCGLLFLILLAQLILIKLPDRKNDSVFYVLILLPFIIPELLFNSLVINPSLVSIVLILFSHILLLKYLKEDGIMFLVLSFVFFGFGVSFRWINGFYLFVLFGDFILIENQKKKTLFSLNRFIKSLKVFPFYILSVIAFIWISGYSPQGILRTFSSATAYIEKAEVSYLSLGATSIAFFTPAFLTLLVLGVFHSIIKKSYRELIWTFIAFIPFFVIGFFPSLKYMITTLLVLIIIAINGFTLLKNRILKFGMLFLIFVFWFVGIQIESNSTWGPRFELKIKNDDLGKTSNFNPDKSLSIENVKLVIGSGMAMPTLEGPRPIYGFIEVFISGWNDFLNFHNQGRKEAVNYSKENNCRILQDVRHAFIYSKLTELNYKTNDNNIKNVSGIYEREFVKNDSSIVVNVFQDKNMLFDKTLMKGFMNDKNKVVIYSSYSNIITKLKTVYNDKFEVKGVYWGVLR